MVLNTFVVGMLVFGLAQLDMSRLQRWEEVGEIVIGLWLIASPFIFGYADDDMLPALACHPRRGRGPPGRAAVMAGLASERSKNSPSISTNCLRSKPTGVALTDRPSPCDWRHAIDWHLAVVDFPSSGLPYEILTHGSDWPVCRVLMDGNA